MSDLEEVELELDDDLYEELRVESEKKGISVEDLVVKILKNQLSDFENLDRLTPQWVKAHQKDLALLWPVCSVCGKKLRIGSQVDHHWPHFSTANMHIKCMKSLKDPA